MSEKVYCVWKIPDDEEQFDEERNPFHDCGVYPTGELMAIKPTRGRAEHLVGQLELHSPSERFGRHEDSRENDMDDAPYQFYISEREVRE